MDVTPSLSKADVAKELKEVLPSDVVECLCHIQLHEQHWCLRPMKMLDCTLQVLKVIVNTTTVPDERALTIGDGIV
jgi:hypothetical protein